MILAKSPKSMRLKSCESHTTFKNLKELIIEVLKSDLSDFGKKQKKHIALLWAVFCINLSFGHIQIPSINISDLIWLGCIYLIPVLTVNLLVPTLSKENRMERVIQIINSIKVNEDIFLTFLKKQPRHPVGKEYSSILWGNSESKITITILTNPHCEPCSQMHKRIGNLLNKTGNKFCVQYIFTSFSEELEPSSRFLIDVYQRYPVEKALEIYDEWFEEGKYQKETMFKKYGFETDKQVPEYSLHKKWQEEQKLTATPIVLVNGYELPDSYKIEDLFFYRFGSRL
jgi:arsenate reductase-like glutaredoxin family protein